MSKIYHIAIKDFTVYLGPHIRKQSYRFADIGTKGLDKSWSKYIKYKASYYYTDLTGYVIDDLLKMGINPAKITISSIDTFARRNYFSHRRSKTCDEQEGRNGFICSLL